MAFNEIGTPEFLNSDTYPAVEDRMVHQNPYICPQLFVGSVAVSFSDQIRLIAQKAPQAYLVTAYSAIPVADTIRAYYETLGLPTPYIGYIRADQYAARDSDRYEQRKAEEIERLQPVIGGLNCVSIVEQYVERRTTLRLAIAILRAIDVRSTPSFDQSNWYHNADRDDIDLDNITSFHKDKMREIGRNAAVRNMRLNVLLKAVN